MTIPGYDAWKLSPPDGPLMIGSREGDTCNRVEEPDEDAPRGYRPKPCAGIMETDANGDTCCNWCGEDCSDAAALEALASQLAAANARAEQARDAALKLARNRLQACAIDHPTGSREMAERSEWADEATAALSTPATEQQGMVENDTIDSFCLTLRRLVSDAYAERDRFGHIAATIRVNALHHGATNAEVEAMLSGEISFVNWIEDKVASRPAPQPAADTRVVVKPLVWKPEDAPCTRFKAEALGGHMMIVELDPETHPGTYSVGVDLGGLCFKFVLAEYDDFLPKYTAPAKFEGIEAAKAAAKADYEARILSAIIGTATPAPSDKIAIAGGGDE